MTEKQAKLVRFIGEYVAKHNYSPSIAEMAKHMGVSGGSTIHEQLVALESRGVLRRDTINGSRNWTLGHLEDWKPKTPARLRKTNRGFNVYTEFKDTYGGTVRVQESSNVLPRVWIFYDHPEDGKVDHATGQIIKMAPHLSPAQVKRVIRALQTYLQTDRYHDDRS